MILACELAGALTVTTAIDEFNTLIGGAGVSLREALDEIDEGGVITFDPALSGRTISNNEAAGDGGIDIGAVELSSKFLDSDNDGIPDWWEDHRCFNRRARLGGHPTHRRRSRNGNDRDFDPGRNLNFVPGAARLSQDRDEAENQLPFALFSL